GLERLLDLLHVAAEVDPQAAPGALLNTKSVAPQPLRNVRKVLIRGSETQTELARGEPLMKVRRSGIELFGEKLIQLGAGRRSNRQRQDHVLHRHRDVSRAAIKFSAGERMHATTDRDPIRVIDQR